jgi:hypothetical protein
MNIVVHGKHYYEVHTLEPGKKYTMRCIDSDSNPAYWSFGSSGIFVKYSGFNAIFRYEGRLCLFSYDLCYWCFYRLVSDDVADMLNTVGSCGKTMKMELVEKATTGKENFMYL